MFRPYCSFGSTGRYIPHIMKVKTEDKLTIDKLLFEKKAADRAIEAREKLGKLIDTQVMSVPAGPKRWRAAVNLWIALGDMYVTPGLTAEQENRAIINQNKAKRDALKDKTYGFMSDKKKVLGGGGDSDLREAINMPQGADMFIKLVQPDIATVENTGKLMKEFPEYRIPERF